MWICICNVCMHLCVDMWIKVEYGFDYRIIWFIESYCMVYRIEFNNRDTKSKSKIAIQN